MASFWDVLKGDVKKVFAFMTSSNGQAAIAIGETAAETIFPQATALLNLVNTWGKEAITVEGIASAAGAATGTGSQKAVYVLSNMTPQVLAFAQSNGLPVPTVAIIASINTDIINILNKLTGVTTVVAAPAIVTAEQTVAARTGEAVPN